MSLRDGAGDNALAERRTKDLNVLADDIMNSDTLRSPSVPTGGDIFVGPWGRPGRPEEVNFAFEHPIRMISANGFPRDFHNVRIGFFFRASCDPSS